jgi:hypothetical protein
VTDPLSARLAAELERPPGLAPAAFAAELARLGAPGVAAVLFYGSALRTGALDGVLDFYVLTDGPYAWPQPRLAAAAGAVLAPNVEYRELEHQGVRLRAKIAVLTFDQFERLCRPESLDTTVWARFAQPAALAWVRDGAARDRAVAAVARACRTAAGWAAALGPEAGPAEAFWNALFAATYAAELRIEPKGRERAILAVGDARWAELLPQAWAADGVGFDADSQGLRPRLTAAERAKARRAWAARRRLGKPLTVLRLTKAVFTFQGAADYAAWKIARHTGVAIEVTPWRRRHPILAAPSVAWTLWKRGVLR